jgi:hypothetical protein
VVGLITDNDETAYREVRDLAVWCQDTNLSLNVIKTKEMIVDDMTKRTEHAPILIDGAAVERLYTGGYQYNVREHRLVEVVCTFR